MWKVWPNVITFTIFIYNCLGHWSLVSFVILIFYGFGNLPVSFTLYLSAVLIPEVLLLLFCGDILQAKRAALFKELDPAAAAQGASRGSEAATAPVRGSAASAPVEDKPLSEGAVVFGAGNAPPA